MSDAAGAWERFGTGPLSRGAAFIYHLLVVELLFLVTAAPGLAVLMLLEHDASNVPLIAACLLPVGPALSAALYAIHHRRLDLADLRPATTFWRGYRLNVRGTLLIWVSWLAGVTLPAMTLTHFSAAGVPRWWAALLLLVATGATLWVMNALVTTSLFAFRARDVARLAAYFLVRTPGNTLGNACLLIVAAAAVAVSAGIVLTLLVSVLVLAWLSNGRSMITIVRNEFTA